VSEIRNLRVSNHVILSLTLFITLSLSFNLNANYESKGNMTLRLTLTLHLYCCIKFSCEKLVTVLSFFFLCHSYNKDLSDEIILFVLNVVCY